MKTALIAKLTIFLIIALISGGFAVVYYLDVTGEQKTLTKLMYDPASELGALQPGTPFSADFIRDHVVEIELPQVSSNAMDLRKDLAWALDATAANRLGIENLVLTSTLQPGDFLRPDDFVLRSEDALARRVDRGNRAFSINVQPGRAVETFLVPGARVDVLSAELDREGGVSTAVVLEDVALMAVGPYQTVADYVEAGRPTYTSLTVQATPAQIATYLGRTEASRGQVIVVLRNPCDSAARVDGACAAEGAGE